MAESPDQTPSSDQTATSKQTTPTKQTTPSKDAPPSPLAVYFWPGLVVTLLGGHALFCLFVVVLATSDPSVAVEPDYYQKAVDWEETQKLRLASRRLGWSTDLTVGNDTDFQGNRELAVRIRDKEGVAVEGLMVELMCYHRARANDRRTMLLSENEPGQYVGKLPIRREGFYEFRLVANRDDLNFLWENAQFIYLPTER